MVAADHIEVNRRHGLFQHHGIDLGDGTIAHYLEGQEIIRSSLEEFKAGEQVKIISHKDACPRRITLQRAISRIGEQRYNLLFNNCEHFANWCKTGRHQSFQIENLFDQATFGITLISSLLPKDLLSGLNIILKEGLKEEKIGSSTIGILRRIKQIKRHLIHTLESTLDEIESLMKTESEAHIKRRKHPFKRQLIKKGQTIADELNSLDELEARITAMISKIKTQN